ncbi:5-oxoprolinase subunit PxpA [Limibacter armeniacum]|uniref:5-oxoprolinase subunit PxpA n=1 Tax=Limibacter armeniacum TaxID=466084 RepID=UPI002FE6444B
MDINCDLGESFGQYTIGNDSEVIRYIDSCNIACGFHAGDPMIMRKTIDLALQHDVKIGAHPGYPDLAGFGRRHMELDHEEINSILLYQIGALKAMTEALGGQLHHVKPHGALYNAAAKDFELAKQIAISIRSAGSNLIFVGQASSQMEKAAKDVGIPFFREAFADRRYLTNGLLVPRSQEGAVIHDTSQAMKQVLQIANQQTVTSIEGTEIPLSADTVCVHGDNANTLAFVIQLREKLNQSTV